MSTISCAAEIIRVNRRWVVRLAVFKVKRPRLSRQPKRLTKSRARSEYRRAHARQERQRDIVNLHIANRFFFAGFEKRVAAVGGKEASPAKKTNTAYRPVARHQTAERCKVTGWAFKPADHAEMVLQVLPDTAQFMPFRPMRLDFIGRATTAAQQICGD